MSTDANKHKGRNQKQLRLFSFINLICQQGLDRIEADASDAVVGCVTLLLMAHYFTLGLTHTVSLWSLNAQVPPHGQELSINRRRGDVVANTTGSLSRDGGSSCEVVHSHNMGSLT